MVITKLTFVILEFSCIFTKKSVLLHERIALQHFHTVIAANSELSAFLILFLVDSLFRGIHASLWEHVE